MKPSQDRNNARARRARIAILALIAAATLLTPSAAPTSSAAGGRVVVLGFDGADARLVEKWMSEGKLPNLAKLRADGTYSPLLPTNPAQTPVSWSSFATGTNPGRTEIFDFLKRAGPKTYAPTIAMADEGKRPFLFGARNALAIGAIGGVALALIVFLGLLFVRTQVVVRALVALSVGAITFAALFWVVSRFLPVELPWAINNRKGDTFWGLAAANGRVADIFRVPVTFPAEDVGQGRMLSGLGVPDMRGTIGRPTYFTSDPTVNLGDNEFSLELERLPAKSGVIESKIIGPYNKAFYGYVLERAKEGITDPDQLRHIREDLEATLEERGIKRQIQIPVTLQTSGDSLTIRVSGREIVLKPGEWSDWVELAFPVNWLVDRMAPVRGIVRFQLFSLEPELRLWMSPVNFHPEFHPVPFTWPANYANELFKEFGCFKTLGWTEDTWSLPTGVGDEQHFLDDMNASIAKDQEMLEAILAKKNSQLYVQVFSFTDRIGHLFWRFIDPGHPLYDAEKAAIYGPEIEKAYRRMDDIVGKARALLGPDDVMIVCSDHGFSSFRRGVNYNTWLVRNGFMTLRGAEEGARNLEDLFDRHGEALFANVDWSRTKAYAMGLGNIYINLYGREPQGIVQEGAEYEQVVKGIQTGLEALVDDKTGEKPVTHVYRRDEMYSGYDPALVPDLRVANALNYRLSWQTTLGGVPPDVIEDNLKAWSGDHCSNEPSLVKGIFFSSRRIATQEDPRIWDLAPSILSLVGAPIPAGLDGRNLYAAGASQ